MQTSSSRGVTPSSSDVFQGSFECIICLETLEGHNLAHFACEHTFCRECLKNHIMSELDQHHYPIICPSCKVGKRRSGQPISTVDLDMMQNLGLGEAELAVFFELQMSAHSIPIHCRKCEETMFVDRTDYQQTKIIECPLPLCNYSWCKDCSQEVVHGGPRHSCDGSKELEMLIKENGWRLCPGCEIPVQKTAGCNHMTCSAPGCNTHFCYQCGKFIIQSLISGDIRKAYKKHYRKCRLF
ncbi:hypothetical protein BDN70DRAFT_813399 [Pholiota conissans]|uniref:RBR-type E3 ubiquitin transferase n=1 Tax=Pholiota conissans TaxID=109636 RepID=A0A9P5YXT7_9AGAR|nr:hypothetical protein BDN70DRAFT_813399 [Pholiota conissans]